MTSHCKFVFMLTTRSAEIVDINYIEKNLILLHFFTYQLYALLIHLLIITNQSQPSTSYQVRKLRYIEIKQEKCIGNNWASEAIIRGLNQIDYYLLV